VSEQEVRLGKEGGRARPPWRRVALIGLMVVVAFALGLLLRKFKTDREGPSSPPEAVATMVEGQLADRPPEAAKGALEAAQAELTPETELAMLDVAVDGLNIEEVVDTGEQATAALVGETTLVTAGRGGSVQVWERGEGGLLGEIEVPVPVELLAETEASSPVLAAVDREGTVFLLDLSDPGRPRTVPLQARLARDEAPLAVAFSEEPSEVVAVGAGGEVLRVDATSGGVLSRSRLSELGGRLPWNAGAKLDLVAARFLPEVYEDEEGLLVATGEGAVADLDLARGQGKTVLAAGIAPGRILSLDRAPYGEPELIVGATGGVVMSGEETAGPNAYPGPPVTGVELDIDEHVWAAGQEGVFVGDTFQPPAAGPPVLSLEPSFDGIAAINPEGKVSVLGPRGVELSMDETEVTPVAAFGAGEHLLVAEGYDPGHIEELHAVRPQPPLAADEYQEDDVEQVYEPGPDWWPQADESEDFYSEEEEGLYVNDVAGNGELVVAGGQDPFGEAAVMAWDAKSGEPLQHLSLGTGGVETELPSVIGEVALLPGRHEVVAYSVAQELLAIWSTESWELEESIPVGAAGEVAVSPDEDTILVVGLEEEEGEENFDETDDATPLIFVDVASGEVVDEVPARGVSEAAFSPDGSILALGDENGFLRLRSAEGREPAGPLVDLEGTPEAMAWRPDGKLIAVSRGAGGVVLVDPASGEVSEPLPSREDYSPVLGLSWSSDGSMLAALEPDEAEESEGYEPAPATVWTLGPDDLKKRMCQLSACGAGEEPAGSRLGDVSQLSAVDLVFRRENDLFAADLEGGTAWIGRMEDYPTPPASYDWSESGFAWSAPGRIGVLLDGAAKPRFWPCACDGVAWRGDEVLSLELGGRNLVAIDPHRAELRTTQVDGLPPHSPGLLGVVGGSPIVSAYESEPDRGTPSAIFQLLPDGSARKLTSDAHGSIFLRWPSSSPRTLAFGTYLSGGACYSTTNVGVVTSGRDGQIEISFPASPLEGEEPASLRSLQVSSEGIVSATIGGIGCDDDGAPLESEPPAERYLLEDGRWEPTGEEGYDVQSADGTPVIEESEGFGRPGTLLVGSSEEGDELATEVDGMVARP
jgi:hypothetical protein